MNYGLSLGVTTHLDQGVFQATNTPNDGAAHEDNYTMQLPFVALHREGRLPARLRINYLHQDDTPALTTLRERIKNTIPFFGDDMIRTGGIGEFIAGGKAFQDAAKLLARAGWRAEVHSLSQKDFIQEIQDYEAAHKESSIANLRWVVAHVPFITEEYVNRLKAIGGGGGKGQRVVAKPKEVAAAVMDVLAESKVLAPGSNRNFLVELNIETTRHNEIQLIGNGSWSLSLGGRDCSVQMHEQKLFEVSLTKELLEAEIASAKGKTRATLEGDSATLARMEAEAERFAAALDANAILPEDF